jgi:hypothetical protein
LIGKHDQPIVYTSRLLNNVNWFWMKCTRINYESETISESFFVSLCNVSFQTFQCVELLITFFHVKVIWRYNLIFAIVLLQSIVSFSFHFIFNYFGKMCLWTMKIKERKEELHLKINFAIVFEKPVLKTWFVKQYKKRKN